MTPEPSSAVILYAGPEGILTIICPKCNLSRRVEAKTIKKGSEGFSVRCRCGEVFRARVEFRRHYRRGVKLAGVYRNLRTGKLGQMMVEDLSLGGVGFRTSGRHDLRTGDILEVTFQLDDMKGSKIRLRAEVKRVQDRLVGTELNQEFRGNRDLGFYLMG